MILGFHIFKEFTHFNGKIYTFLKAFLSGRNKEPSPASTENWIRLCGTDMFLYENDNPNSILLLVGKILKIVVIGKPKSHFSKQALMDLHIFLLFNEINISEDKIYLKVKFKIQNHFDCFENITLQFQIIVQ